MPVFLLLLVNSFRFIPMKMYKAAAFLERLLETLWRCDPQRGYRAGEGEWKENAHPNILGKV